MEFKLSIYLIPPVLTLMVGLTLAILALAKGKFKSENILFAMVSLWLSLLSPLFISHHFIEDQSKILIFERGIHFFYVYAPVIYIAFLYNILKLKSKLPVIITFLISLIISLFTQTDYYIYGLYEYSWGYIAKGGIVFKFFGIYSFAVLGHSIHCFIRSLKKERNPIVQLKYRYILLSFFIVVILTMLNIPAMHGYDLYPAGNFSFVALGIMAYGVLRYHLIDLKTAVHKTFLWLLLSSLILLTNALIFKLTQNWIRTAPAMSLFGFIAFWFALNAFYLFKIQPRIGSSLNKTRTSLQKAKFQFLEDITQLKTLSDMVDAIKMLFYRTLSVDRVGVYIREHESKILLNDQGDTLDLQPNIERWLVEHNKPLNCFQVESNPAFEPIESDLISLFDLLKANDIIPLIRDNSLLGLILLPQRKDQRQVTTEELTFIKGITQTTSVALANSFMFQRITNLKEQLEKQTIDLSLEIAERNRAEEALRVSETSYRLLAENVKDIIWTVDLDKLKFTFISPSAKPIFGADIENTMGMPISDILPVDSLNLVKEKVLPQIVREKAGFKDPSWSQTIELEVYDIDKSKIWSEVTLSFLRGPLGEALGLMGITRDITDRRQHQAMQIEKVRAEKANIAKSEFLANMSHELRTPLNHIIGFTELVVGNHFGTLNPKQSEYLNDVLDSGRHLLSLINDILDLSKVEAGHMEPTLEQVNLTGLLENSLLMIKEKALKHGLTISTALKDIPEFIHADERMLKQIIYNLLSNAAKFTPHAGKIELSARRITSDNETIALQDGRQIKLPWLTDSNKHSFVQITVKDTGIGLEKKHLERIFNSFDQVDNSSSRVYEGTGLGLSLTKRFVELHQGVIWAESEGLEKGSCFNFILPIIV